MTALEALERDDYSRLPGGIFSRAFIRAYATEVGLDPETTVAEFLTEFGRYEREAATVQTQRGVSDDDLAFLERQRRATRVFRLVALLVAVGLGAIALWEGPRLLERLSPEPRAAARTEPKALEPPPAAPAPPEDQPAAAPTGSLSVEFTVTADCAVQVSADGVTVFFKDMRAGDRQRVSAQRDLLVQVDNAGAFVWTINGRPAKPLGALGEKKKAHVTPATVGDFLQ